MGEIKSFQDLNVWQESHRLTLEIYHITKTYPKEEIYGLISQIRRAASSVPANIAEGMGRNSTKELLYFIYNARGSLQETIYHLILSKDLQYIKNQDFEKIYNRYNGLAVGINAFIKKLKQ
jgi:four helix bundle protein